MQSAEASDSFQQQVLEGLNNVSQRLDRLTTDVAQLTTDVEQLATDVEKLKQELALTNTRVDTYQKASNQVVNLAFGLIATATVTIIASVILK